MPAAPGFMAQGGANVVTPPIVTLPQQAPGVPPMSETQEPPPVPPPAGGVNTR
jgi:hypothetical protein